MAGRSTRLADALDPVARLEAGDVAADSAPGADASVDAESSAQSRIPTRGEAAILTAVRFVNREYRVGAGGHLQGSADLRRCARADWIHASGGWWLTSGGDAALGRVMRAVRTSSRCHAARTQGGRRLPFVPRCGQTRADVTGEERGDGMRTFGRLATGEEVTRDCGRGIGAVGHKYDTSALATLAALAPDDLDRSLRKARVTAPLRAEIEEAATNWRDGKQAHVSDRAGKACTRVAEVISLRSRTQVSGTTSEDGCADCTDRRCTVADGVAMSTCRSCGGGGTAETSASRVEITCPNCFGRGRHRCRCTRCHA